jgi:hypothetical protein
MANWFYEDVEFVSSNGLFVGTSADKFSPDVPVTRAMLVTVLHRLEGLPSPSGDTAFIDAPAGQWHSEAVAWAAENGIVLGVGDGMFAPMDDVTRQDLASVIVRYAEATGRQFPVTLQYKVFDDDDAIAGYAKNAVQTLCGGGIINGKPGNVFDPLGSATRAEVAATIRRFVEATGGA